MNIAPNIAKIYEIMIAYCRPMDGKSLKAFVDQ